MVYHFITPDIPIRFIRTPSYLRVVLLASEKLSYFVTGISKSIDILYEILTVRQE